VRLPVDPASIRTTNSISAVLAAERHLTFEAVDRAQARYNADIDALGELLPRAFDPLRLRARPGLDCSI
jgi:hypothetical protein